VASESPELSKRELDTRVQRIIDALVRRAPELSLDELYVELQRRLDEAELAGMPEPWIRAVAQTAAAGNPYICSPLSAKDHDVPKPAESQEAYGVG
jgi:hypothetical protein